MICWIADGDVSSALSLKKKIKSEKFFGHGDEVEVFYDITSLQKKFSEVEKKKKEKPGLLLMDAYTLGDEDFTVLGPIWEAWAEDVLLICVTSMSLGRLELIYQRRDMVLLSFLKSEFDQQWDLIVSEIKARSGFVETKSSPRAPGLKATELALKGQLRDFEKKYYLKTGLSEAETRAFVISQTRWTKNLGLTQLEEKLEKLTHLFAQPVSPGTLRLRKEVREYLLLAHKVFPDLEA